MKTADARRVVAAKVIRSAVADLEMSTAPRAPMAEMDAKRRNALDVLLEAARQLEEGAEEKAGPSTSVASIEWAIRFGRDFGRRKNGRVGVEWMDSHGETRWTYGASYDEAIQKAMTEGEVNPSTMRTPLRER